MIERLQFSNRQKVLGDREVVLKAAKKEGVFSRKFLILLSKK
tara:strand:- start:3917 stop:4042 length:126 start_codon:yes stop_codon:yes gene_type:complete